MNAAIEATEAVPAAALRRPEEIMTPEGLSAFKASRLSFLRAMVRRIVAERWRIERRRFELDDEGRGTAVYRIHTADAPLHFVVFSDKLSESQKTDRIINNRYEGEAFLCLGEPTEARVAFQRGQFADFLTGRADPETIGWTRVNRSGRLFDHIVESLAAGRQPEPARVAETGYLVRNNGFWGNGKHGSAIMPAFPPDRALGRPYHSDLFTLYMWRHFSLDLVEHIARRRNPGAAALAPAIKRFLGVGNATGLGLIPYTIRYPRRVHHWCRVRESAIAQVKARPLAAGDADGLVRLIDRTIAFFGQGLQVRPGIFTGSARLVADLGGLRAKAVELRDRGTVAGTTPALAWATLCDWAAGALDRECLELLHSLLIELYPDIADGLEPEMMARVDAASDVRPERRVGDLLALVRRNYDWALALDLGRPSARRHFWYLSEDNLEPRHGVRGADPGEEYETFVDVAGSVQALAADLAQVPAAQSVAAFLFAHPRHRFIVERVESTIGYDYGEIRANVLDADFEPCHLIRFMLTLYGMEKCDPQSRLWVRGTFLQGAPLAEEVAAGIEGDWIYPLPPAPGAAGR